MIAGAWRGWARVSARFTATLMPVRTTPVPHTRRCGGTRRMNLLSLPTGHLSIFLEPMTGSTPAYPAFPSLAASSSLFVLPS